MSYVHIQEMIRMTQELKKSHVELFVLDFKSMFEMLCTKLNASKTSRLGIKSHIVQYFLKVEPAHFRTLTVGTLESLQLSIQICMLLHFDHKIKIKTLICRCFFLHPIYIRSDLNLSWSHRDLKMFWQGSLLTFNVL